MSLRHRLQVLAAQVETTKGTAETVWAASDAPVEIYDLAVKPIQDFEERVPFSNTLGGSGDLPTTASFEASFATELIGSKNAVVTPPPFDPYILGCGYRRVPALSLILTGIAGTFLSGEVVDDGGGNTATVLHTEDAATNLLYIHTQTGTFSAGTLTGATSGATATITGDSVAVGFAYLPTSFESVQKTLSFAHYNDGIRDIAAGALGSVMIKATSSKAVRLAFEFKGKWISHADVPLLQQGPAPTDPLAFKAANLRLRLGSDLTDFVPTFTSIELSIGHLMDMRENANDTTGSGYETAVITERAATGSLAAEMTLVAEHDWQQKMRKAEVGPLTFKVGTVAGNQFSVQAPNTQYGAISRGEVTGLVQADVELKLKKRFGDDELVIIAF